MELSELLLEFCGFTMRKPKRQQIQYVCKFIGLIVANIFLFEVPTSTVNTGVRSDPEAAAPSTRGRGRGRGKSSGQASIDPSRFLDLEAEVDDEEMDSEAIADDHLGLWLFFVTP